MSQLEPSWYRPRVAVVRRSILLICIQACHDCAVACLGCVEACIHESERARLAPCISRGLDCAAVCTATEQVLARAGDRDRSALNALLRACIASCRTCDDACWVLADTHDRCRVCAEACRACAVACEALLAAEAYA